jgi:flavin reductase (DIM6/NTAB) family NADH-FMN oxidoreductase RutF
MLTCSSYGGSNRSVATQQHPERDSVMTPRKMTLDSDETSSTDQQSSGATAKSPKSLFKTKPNSSNSKHNANKGSGECEWKSYAVSDLSSAATYRLGISSVIPRPVGVLTTVSESGVVNCAPYAYTGLMSHDPPIMSHGICMNRDGSSKDTLVNIEFGKEWVCHILTTDFLEEANQCAAALSCDQSEVEATGMELLQSDMVKTPRLQKAPIAMECQLFDKKELYNDAGKHTSTIVFGRVVKYHIRSDVLTEDCDLLAGPLVDLDKVQAVGRAGGNTFWPVGTSATNESNPKAKTFGGGGRLDISRPS